MQLLLIGCGHLGKILLKNWAQNNTFEKIVVIQPSLTAQHLFQDNEAVSFYKTYAEIPHNFKPNFVVIAVKPQILPDVLHHYKRFQEAIFVSVAVSISTKYLEEHLQTSNVVRIMPNVAAQIGESMNLAFASYSLTAPQKQSIAAVFAPTGKLVWLDDEKLIDLLTPIAGSGAAYVFLFMQSLIKTAMGTGIDEAIATAIVKQMLLGSVGLAMQEEADLAKMITSVASKGGTTEAALTVLNAQLPALIQESYTASIKRLNELQK